MSQVRSPYEIRPQPPAAPGVVVVAVRPTNTAAVIGFVLSLVGISLPALVVSATALRTTKDGTEAGHGLAVAGLVIGTLGTLTWTAVVAPPLLAALALVVGGVASGY